MKKKHKKVLNYVLYVGINVCKSAPHYIFSLVSPYVPGRLLRSSLFPALNLSALLPLTFGMPSLSSSRENPPSVFLKLNLKTTFWSTHPAPDLGTSTYIVMPTTVTYSTYTAFAYLCL
ncbi:hypothetical protein XENTR_v10013706 [Xenopus tropicalis]|nr:hypothetical protein XENTR_v10013706 [Xenopus tropicalis]